ncbi:MAG: tetratricopeptide repeat protein [Gemmataceae bacterium]
MRRDGWLIVALVVGGCASPEEERLRFYNQQADHLFQMGDYRSAGEHYQAALSLRPENPELLYHFGQCHDYQGDVARAEHYYRECLQRAPKHAACRRSLSALLVRTNRWSEASALVADWMQQDPKAADAYTEDGWLWLQRGDVPKAQARFQQALGFDPHNPRALVELARLYEKMHRPDRALVLYERCLLKNPQQPDIEKRIQQLQAQGVNYPIPEH